MVLVRKPERERERDHLGRPKHKRQNNVKTNNV